MPCLTWDLTELLADTVLALPDSAAAPVNGSASAPRPLKFFRGDCHTPAMLTVSTSLFARTWTLDGLAAVCVLILAPWAILAVVVLLKKSRLIEPAIVLSSAL